MWLWCYKNGNWITAVHLPGVDNTTADLESRSVHDNTEWKLNPVLFNKLCSSFGIPEIDLFASRLNAQVQKYCSWKPDPGAYAVDALAENLATWQFYAFPPFNLIGKVLQKIEIEQATGIIVVPYWPTQPWFSKFTQLCYDVPVILFSRQADPTLLHPWRPLQQLPAKTRLLGALVSGHPSKNLKSRTTQRGFSWPPGDQALGPNMHVHSNIGITIAIQGVQVQIHQV